MKKVLNAIFHISSIWFCNGKNQQFTEEKWNAKSNLQKEQRAKKKIETLTERIKRWFYWQKIITFNIVCSFISYYITVLRTGNFRGRNAQLRSAQNVTERNDLRKKQKRKRKCLTLVLFILFFFCFYLSIVFYPKRMYFYQMCQYVRFTVL